MKMKKYNDKMIVDQVRYMCELWQKGMFDGCSSSQFVQAVTDVCNAKGKTDRYINKILDKDLKLNG